MGAVLIVIVLALVILGVAALAIWGQKRLHEILDSIGSPSEEIDPTEVWKDQKEISWMAEHYYHSFVPKTDRKDGVFFNLLQEDPESIVQGVLFHLDHIILVYEEETQKKFAISNKDALARAMVKYIEDKYLKG